MGVLKATVGLLGLSFFVFGCATTGYVNKKVKTLEEADRANAEKISTVEASHEARLAEAMRVASEAKDEASRAAAMRALPSTLRGSSRMRSGGGSESSGGTAASNPLGPRFPIKLPAGEKTAKASRPGGHSESASFAASLSVKCC